MLQSASFFNESSLWLKPLYPFPTPEPDWLISLLLFVTLSSFYFATVSGITSSNDGSHYALTRTIVQNRTFALKQFDDYAEGNDIAIRDNVLYSDRPPGTALLATAFYQLGSLLPSPLSPLPSRHDADNPSLLYVLLLPVWAGAGTAVLLYLLLRRLSIDAAVAVTAVLFFALGTIHWKYSTVLFSHALSAFLASLSIFLLSSFRPPGRFWPTFFLGFILGYSVLVEYSNGLLVIIVGLYLLGKIRPFTIQNLTRTLLPFALGGLIPALFLAYYNNINFGSPITLSYAYALNYPWASQFSTTFNYPILAGLRSLIIFGTGDGQCDPVCYNQGFLLLSPILALAIPGFYFYARQSRKVFVLTTAVFLTYLLLFAAHRTSHGFTGDGRYLTPFLSFLALPLAYALAWLQQQQTTHPLRHTLLALFTYALFFLSTHNIFLHIGLSYNYTLDLTQLNELIASPQNWYVLFTAVFPNVGNLPLLWLLEGGLLLCFIILRFVIRRQRAARP